MVTHEGSKTSFVRRHILVIEGELSFLSLSYRQLLHQGFPQTRRLPKCSSSFEVVTVASGGPAKLLVGLEDDFSLPAICALNKPRSRHMHGEAESLGIENILRLHRHRHGLGSKCTKSGYIYIYIYIYTHTDRYRYIDLDLSIYLSIFLSFYLSIYLSIYIDKIYMI